MLELAYRMSGKRLELNDFFYFVAPEFYPHGDLGAVYGKHFDDVSAHSERRAFKLYVAPFILYLDKSVNELFSVYRHARAQRYSHAVIFERRAETVYARHRRHDDNVSALAKRARSRVAQLVYLVVYGQIFFYISIRPRDISLRLIIVVIRYEVFYSVVGKNSLNSLQSWAASVLL